MLEYLDGTLSEVSDVYCVEMHGGEELLNFSRVYSMVEIPHNYYLFGSLESGIDELSEMVEE